MSDVAVDERAAYNDWKRFFFVALGRKDKNIDSHHYEKFYERNYSLASKELNYVQIIEHFLNDPSQFKWKDSEIKYSLLDFQGDLNKTKKATIFKTHPNFMAKTKYMVLVYTYIGYFSQFTCFYHLLRLNPISAVMWGSLAAYM